MILSEKSATSRDHALGKSRRGTAHHLVRSVARLYLFFLVKVGKLVAIEVEHEEANGRRLIAVLPRRIDRGDQIRQGDGATAGDLLQPPPERILEAHARLMSRDDDGALDDRRFHEHTPICCSRATSQQEIRPAL